jgi:hypothetical protein
MTKAYEDVKHCIYCGKKYDSSDEVIQHIKEKHMAVGGGQQ